MHIGYLTGQYPRATDTFIQREVSALRELGITIQTFSIRRPELKQLVGNEQKEEFEQTFYLIPPKLFLLLKSHIFLFLAGFYQYLRAVKLAWNTCQPGLKGFMYQLFYFLEAGILAQQLKTQKVQHLHNHLADSSCTVAMLAAELANISFSFTIHGPYIFFEPYRWFLTEKIKKALFVSCISDFCRSQCMLFSPMEHWPKLYIVHCGVNPKLFRPVTHEGLGYRLLYVGRLAAAKGFPVLLKSLSVLKETYSDLTLTVIGDGEERSDFEAMTSEMGLSKNVAFLGYQSQTKVRQHLQETDIFVLPSFAEGVPVSLMEAMASGVPVISTRIAGISELVEEGKSGYLLPPGNVEQLSEKISQLYTDPELRKSFGQVGRDRVSKEFNLQQEPLWLSEIIKASINGKQISTRPSFK